MTRGILTWLPVRASPAPPKLPGSNRALLPTEHQMYGTSTQHNGLAAVAVARARYVGGVANDLMASTTEASWSIPCTVPATFHKPRPRRPQVISS